MRNAFSFTAIVAVAMALAACSTGGEIKTGSKEVSRSVPLSEGSPNSIELKVNLEYPVAGGTVSEAAAASMTGQIVEAALGEGENIDIALGSFVESTVNEYRDNCLQLLEELGDDSEPMAALNWESTVDSYYSGRYRDAVTFTVSKYDYTGGAHGSTEEVNLNFRMSDGSLITEKDLFVENYEEPLSEILTTHLGETVTDSDDYNALFIKDIRPNGRFKLSEDFLTYVYGQYEIGPYYLGIIEVSIPWEELDGLLK